MTPRKIEPSAIVPLPQYAGQRTERRKHTRKHSIVAVRR